MCDSAFEMKSFESPDERRAMDRCSLDLVNLPGVTIARSNFKPGWRWSTDLAPSVGTESCQVKHTGCLVSGRLHVRMDDGRELEFGPGDAFVVSPGHDAWVAGDEEVVGLDFAPTPTSRRASCPCGVEFRLSLDGDVEHLIAAVQQHALGSHGHELTSDQVLAGVSATA